MRLSELKKLVEQLTAGGASEETPVETPIAATLQNGTIVLNGATATYYKDRNRVFLDGRVRSGSWKDGEALFTLPADYTPPTGKRFKAVVQDEQTSSDIPTGNLYVYGLDSGTPGKVCPIGTAEAEYVDINLEGINFPVDPA